MPGFIGPMEIALLALVALLVFGPKKLPEIGRTLGKGMRSFKESVGGFTSSLDDEAEPHPVAAIEPRLPEAVRDRDDL